MPSPEAHTPRAEVFAALGDPTRLALLNALSGGQRRSLASMAANSQMTRQAVAKHLRVLEKAGIVSRARSGRESRYGLQPAPLEEARDYLASISAQWDETLGRLKAFVEGDDRSV